MNRKSLFAALACALLTFSMLGCGTTNNLQSITLNASLINGVAPTGQAGFFTLQGNGGTIQLEALANYSGSGSKDISSKVTYTVKVDPTYSVDAFGNALLPPCYGPCPQSGSQGTVEISPTGLVTAVEPATCTWVDIGPSGTPAWFYVGDYVVTATYGGITSQPVYIPVASSAGNTTYQGVENNPEGLCGPTS
ncbi:MAG: hypothetical protein ABSD75_20205 [Terriglobales bacterium]